MDQFIREIITFQLKNWIDFSKKTERAAMGQGRIHGWIYASLSD